MTPIIFRAAADADIDDDYEWYESQRAGVGDQFFADLLATLNTISSHPMLFQVVKRNTRRAVLRRFPYAVYYRIRPQSILVVACIHGRRSPARWRSRD